MEGSTFDDWATPAPLAESKTKLRHRQTGRCQSSAQASVNEAPPNILHENEARMLPVAQVTPSKAEQSPPRKSFNNVPSSVNLKSRTLYHSDIGDGLPHHMRQDSTIDDEFISIDATLNQSLLADTELSKNKWISKESHSHPSDRDFNKSYAHSYSTCIPHKRSPLASSVIKGCTPTGDVHFGMRHPGKVSVDSVDKPGFTSTYGASLQSHDLTHWQQQLQQKRLEQQLEQLQISHTANHPYSGAFTSSFTALPGSPQFGQYLGTLEGVIRAKENLLEEKNLVIERQKLELAHSQDQLRQKQEQERQFMYTRVQEDKGDFLLIKVQEYQYENASLKAQLSEHSSIKAVEMEQLNKKLGETEYEYQQLKKVCQEAEKSKVMELKELELKFPDAKTSKIPIPQEMRPRPRPLGVRPRSIPVKSGLETETKTCLETYNTVRNHSQMNQKDESREEMKAKYSRIKEKYDKLKKRVSSLERYMGDLPTAEQHLKNTEVIKNLCDKEKLLKERISQLESSLAEARNNVLDRDLRVSQLEKMESDLNIELRSLRREASRLQSLLGAPKDADPADLKLFSHTAMEELILERDEAKSEVDKLRKMIESKHRELKTQQSHHQKALSGLEERLQQEEDTITALRETSRSKEEHLRKMKESMTALAKQSQELYEHNLDVQERNQTLEKIASSDVLQANHHLIKELEECVAELHGLVQVCTQRAEGQEPNVSVLLRFRAPSFSSLETQGAEGGQLTPDLLHGRLKQVKELRVEIDRLRSLVSNKYAEDMGNECITQ